MLLNYNVNIKPLKTIDFSTVRIINTINPHSYCISKKDKDFENSLKSSDLLLADGIGIVWAERLLNNNKIQKIAGYDIFIHLMQYLEVHNGSCFFLGSSDETLNKITTKIKREYPNVVANKFSPPYKTEFSDFDNQTMCNEINKYKPDVLFVGMTAPKQEKWVYYNANEIDSKLICSIGAVFDFYAETIKRPKKIWINLGLEWLPRLIKEPKRLFYRNFVSTPKFITEVLSYKFFNKGIL